MAERKRGMLQSAALRDGVSAEPIDVPSVTGETPAFAPTQDVESSLREAIQAVADFRRREQKSAKAAAAARASEAALRESEAHRLGSALLERRSIWAWIAVASRHWMNARAPRPSVTDATPEPAQPRSLDLRLGPGCESLCAPLTIDSQTVVVSPLSVDAQLWITLIAPRQGSRCTVELRFEDLDASDALPQHRRVELIAGETVRLGEWRSNGKKRRLSISRVRGELALVKVEQRSASPAAAQAFADPSSAAVDARRFGAAELEKKLWGGYAAYAVPALEYLRDAKPLANWEREKAAWFLARWHYAHGAMPEALHNIRAAQEAATRPQARLTLTEAQILTAMGRYPEAAAAISSAKEHTASLALLGSTVAWHLADTAESPEQADAVRLAAINAVLERAGLAPIRKKTRGLPLEIANIDCEAPAADAPRRAFGKVSVIMPAYNAADTIAYAIGSVLEQTWRDLELIVVDDGSTDGTPDIVAAFAAGDARVRLVRNAVNQGAYYARNLGLREASGDLVMAHDSDDWSHPERLARQVRALGENPAAVAVKSYAVRVGRRLEMLGPWVPKGSLFELNFSSLLFPRSLVESLGAWDEVRVGGDAELYSRLRARFGQRAVLTLPRDELLAFVLTREGSLSRAPGTSLRSNYYGLRWNYADAYLGWHTQLDGQASCRPTERARRRFPLPVSNDPRRAGERLEYDLVVIADFAEDDVALAKALQALRKARGLKRSAAIFHWRSYERPARTPLVSEVYAACRDLDVDILSAGDTASAGIVLVASDSVLSHKIDPVPSIAADRVYVIGASADDRLGHDAQFHGERLRSTLSATFGHSGTWVTAVDDCFASPEARP
jgi:glycosyltransferase involved in cell wall biosynthesis